MKYKTKRQVEAKISETITKLKKEHIGKAPREVKSYIIDDIVIIRLRGRLTILEQQLTENTEGVRLIKLGRIYLLEKSKDVMDNLLHNLLNVQVTGFYIDVNPKTGDMFIVLELSENIESKFLKYRKSA